MFFNDNSDEYVCKNIGISVIVPVRGSRKVTQTVNSIVAQKFCNCEILVLRNGGNSYDIDEDYPEIAAGSNVIVKQICLTMSGKGRVLNYGFRIGKYPIIAIVDADCMLGHNALVYAIKRFEDLSIAAVGCKIVAVGHLFKPMTIFQELEYSKVFNIVRPLFNLLNSNFIISGAFGVFRKDSVLNIGGYDEYTVGEDLELVLRMQRILRKEKCHKVVYEKKAVCFTEVPSSIIKLMKQRDRWQRGLFDSLLKNCSMIFNWHYGLLGLVILPLQLIFELNGPIAIIIGVTGFFSEIVNWKITHIYIFFEMLICFLSEIIEFKENTNILKVFLKSFVFTLFGIALQIPLSIARIFGMVTFKKRKLKW